MAPVARPFSAEDRDGVKQKCNLIGCGQEAPKYTGNRGIAVSHHQDEAGYVEAIADLQFQSEAPYADAKNQWVAPLFFISVNI